jgi:predicted HD phosphohydrolase
MVEQLSSREGTDSHQVLGAAVVHEIGHLYLGNNGQAHSKAGVMCGAWSHREFALASIGELNFTHEQGARIRATMNAASGW